MKRLLLVGAGHAHLGVLRDFARERPPGLRAVLLTPHPHLVYSGMAPGVVAGHYRAEEAAITIAPLAKAAGVELRLAEATALDAGARSVTSSDGSIHSYDVLSLDCGSLADVDAIEGARDHAWPARPLDAWLARLGAIDALASTRAIDMVVVGGGAAGFELALGLQHRLDDTARVALVTGGAAPLAGYHRRVVERGRRALQRRRVTVFEDLCAAIGADHVRLRSGARLACDVAVLATGGASPPWLRRSGLALDDAGFVATGPMLQSTSHPAVFAAGDVASRADRSDPRSGVFAVRAGPALALNLRRALAGGALQPHQPKRRALNLISCGERRAIVAWGDLAAEGGWAWRWKNRIDQRFVRA